MRTKLSEEGSTAGKSGRRKKMTSRWMDLVTVVMSASLEDLKDQIKDK